jgi:hypothetical protein
MTEQNQPIDPMDEVEAKPLTMALYFVGVFAIFVGYMFFWSFLLKL